MANNEVYIRPAVANDEAFVLYLLYHADMDELPSLDEVFVAVNDANEPVGLIRVQPTALGYHVAPVVVAPEWRGCGIGRLLMDFALERFGTLKLVARGSAVPFYRALGYREISFDEISNELEEDCVSCPYFEECGPVPFMMTRIDECVDE